jgi:hypothetical protein
LGFHKGDDDDDDDEQFTSYGSDFQYTLHFSANGDNSLPANLTWHIRSEDGSNDHHFTAAVLLLHVT